MATFISFYGGTTLANPIELASLGEKGDYHLRDGKVWAAWVWAASGLGDVNGDGFDDIFLEATRANSPTGTRRGASFVLFGDSTLPASLEATDIDSRGVIIRGVDEDDKGSFNQPTDADDVWVRARGDFNGDGFNDIVMGSVLADGIANTLNSAGEGYLVYGGDFSNIVTHMGTDQGDTIEGTADDDTMIGGQGDDLLAGNGGADVLRGGQGDDILSVGNMGFARLNGGNGTDTLRFDGADAGD